MYFWNAQKDNNDSCIFPKCLEPDFTKCFGKEKKVIGKDCFGLLWKTKRWKKEMEKSFLGFQQWSTNCARKRLFFSFHGWKEDSIHLRVLTMLELWGYLTWVKGGMNWCPSLVLGVIFFSALKDWYYMISWFMKVCFSYLVFHTIKWCRLLNPQLESSASHFVGTYILQLLLHLPSQMAPHIRDLVFGLVRRMQSCQVAVLRNSLLLIFARLVLWFNFLHYAFLYI